MLAQLSLVDCHKVIGQALSRDWVRLWNDFLDSLGRVSINEAEVLEVLVIRRREVKVGRNVARQSANKQIRTAININSRKGSSEFYPLLMNELTEREIDLLEVVSMGVATEQLMHAL